jgi:hypothetical protein
LAIDKLAEAISELERHEHRAELRFRVAQFSLDARERDAKVVATKIERAIS